MKKKKAGVVDRMNEVEWETILLSVIILLGLFIRIYSLGSAPFWVDESISAIAAKNIVLKGVPVFDSGLFYDRALFFHYAQAASFTLLGLTDFAARLPSVLFGTLTILLSYYIGKEYSKSGGILCALFTAVFYLEVFYSRQARFYQLFQLAVYLTIFCAYKARSDKKWLYFALASFVLAYDTQLAGLVLAPLLIILILVEHRKQWYLAFIPGAAIALKLLPSAGLAGSGTAGAFSYAADYYAYFSNMEYAVVFCIIGAVLMWNRNKRLSLFIGVPSVLLLCSVLFISEFALRYAYFIFLPLIIYGALFFSYLYEKFGKVMIFTIIAVLILPSNIVFPQTYVNVLMPVTHNLNDATAPQINYKTLDPNALAELRSGRIVTMFSPSVEWYIRKPDYVIPFSMTGHGKDTISLGSVDMYSGRPVISEWPTGTFYLVTDRFSSSKPREMAGSIPEYCTTKWTDSDYRVYSCVNPNI